MLQWLNSFFYVHKANGDLNDITMKRLYVPVAAIPGTGGSLPVKRRAA
jgi:hypothetical protein